MNIQNEITALKRERIIEAAVDLFYDRGYENTNLDAVAKKLGVTKPFIYAHFDAKTQLLAEICSRGISSAVQAFDQAYEGDYSPTERLRRLSIGFVSSVLRAQKHIAIFTREEKNLLPNDLKRIQRMRRDFDRRLTDLLKEGVARKEFRIADTNLAALSIGGVVSWAYVWYREKGRLSLEEVAEGMTQLILSMVGVAPK